METSMNKQEAIQAMRAGYKVTHEYFTPEEWMSAEGNKVKTEEGYLHDWEEFWSYRTGDGFDDGYSLYDEGEILGNGEELVLPYIKRPDLPNMYDGIYGPMTKRQRNETIVPVESRDTTSRNDPCPCGSGKKYKKCCLIT